MAVPAVLAAGGDRGAAEPVEPAIASIARQERRDRRLPRAAAAPRAGDEPARGAGALARCPQSGELAVGWVEQRETHRRLWRSRWVSLRSTHPTACFEEARSSYSPSTSFMP